MWLFFASARFDNHSLQIMGGTPLVEYKKSNDTNDGLFAASVLKGAGPGRQNFPSMWTLFSGAVYSDRDFECYIIKPGGILPGLSSLSISPSRT